MTSDELQNLTIMVRWVGFIVTSIGLVITFSSNWIADKTISKQREEKAEAKAKSAAELKEAKDQIVELSAKAAPRTISSTQRLAFLAAAKDKPKGLVMINPPGGQHEPFQYGVEIQKLLEEAGYTVQMGGYILPFGAMGGMALTMKTGEQYPEFTDGLMACFAAAGINLQKAPFALQPDNTLCITIGNKL